MNLNLEHIIKQRLALQSTQKRLKEEFNLPNDFDYIKSERFIEMFKKWDKLKQFKLAEVLGGKVNEKDTVNFLLTKYEKII